MSEKRSIDIGFAQPDLFGDVPPPGVGARHRPRRPPGGGGGYPKICGIQNFRVSVDPPPDPRFSELEKIGLPGAWLRLARLIGFDAFLEIWRLISNDESTRHDGGRRMPKLREYNAYLTYQRNQYILSLSAAGLDPTQVQKLVRSNLREQLSIEHVQRLMKKRLKSANNDI